MSLETRLIGICKWSLLHYVWLPIYVFNMECLDPDGECALARSIINLWAMIGLPFTFLPAAFVPGNFIYKANLLAKRGLISLAVGTFSAAASIGALIVVALAKRAAS